MRASNARALSTVGEGGNEDGDDGASGGRRGAPGGERGGTRGAGIGGPVADMSVDALQIEVGSLREYANRMADEHEAVRVSLEEQVMNDLADHPTIQYIKSLEDQRGALKDTLRTETGRTRQLRVSYNAQARLLARLQQQLSDSTRPYHPHANGSSGGGGGSYRPGSSGAGGRRARPGGSSGPGGGGGFRAVWGAGGGGGVEGTVLGRRRALTVMWEGGGEGTGAGGVVGMARGGTGATKRSMVL
jgi:hypothetical protein